MQEKAWVMRVHRVLKGAYDDVKLVFFGSRARGDSLKESDYDIIVVSKKFEGIPFTERIKNVLKLLWEHGITEDVDVICYTPEEFEKKKKQLGIVSIAIKEGIILE